MRNLKAAVILLALLAAGCASRNYAQMDHQACESYGIYWGTPEYAQCRTAMLQMRQQDKANRVAAWGALMSTQPRRATTNCYTTGQTVRCW